MSAVLRRTISVVFKNLTKSNLTLSICHIRADLRLIVETGKAEGNRMPVDWNLTVQNYKAQSSNADCISLWEIPVHNQYRQKAGKRLRS